MVTQFSVVVMVLLWVCQGFQLVARILLGGWFAVTMMFQVIANMLLEGCLNVQGICYVVTTVFWEVARMLQDGNLILDSCQGVAMGMLGFSSWLLGGWYATMMFQVIANLLLGGCLGVQGICQGVSMQLL